MERGLGHRSPRSRERLPLSFPDALDHPFLRARLRAPHRALGRAHAGSEKRDGGPSRRPARQARTMALLLRAHRHLAAVGQGHLPQRHHVPGDRSDRRFARRPRPPSDDAASRGRLRRIIDHSLPQPDSRPLLRYSPRQSSLGTPAPERVRSLRPGMGGGRPLSRPSLDRRHGLRLLALGPLCDDGEKAEARPRGFRPPLHRGRSSRFAR